MIVTVQGSSEFPVIDRISVDLVVISKYEREWDFTVLAAELLREVASYACVAACTLGPEPTWDRGRAAVGGNVVRLYKLLSALLEQTFGRRRETSAILARLAFETVVNIRYLIKNFSADLIDSFIRHSLRHERRLWDEVTSNITARKGIALPIEDRILRSVERAFDMAGIKIESIDLTDRTHWGEKNIYQKAKSIGLEGGYLAMFGGMSHHVHGSWQDLYEYHLSPNEDGTFNPETEWRLPRPQMLFAIGTLVLLALRDFFWFVGGDDLLNEFDDRLRDLHARIAEADKAHEAYLSRKIGSAV